jgi:cytochrome P450/nitrite reductase/ring-hydroxylating ferredoxin subunit
MFDRTKRRKTMKRMVRIATLRELGEGRPIAAHIADVDLVVVRCGDRVLALQGLCPHQGTMLAEGSLERGVLTCRGHGWRFDCESGARVDAPGTALRTFSARIEGDAVWVDRDELLAWQTLREPSEPDQASLPGSRAIARLPGPKGLPILGNLLQLHFDALHLDLEKWARQHGPMYTFSIAKKPVVVIGEPGHILAILRDRPGAYRRLSAIQAVNRELGIGGVFSAEGEDWRRQRGLVTPGLDLHHVRGFFPTLTQISERLRNRWAKLASAGCPIDVQQDLVRYAVDVTTNFVFDCDMNMLERREEVFQNHLRQIMPAINRRVNALFPYWRYLRLPADRAVDQAVQALRDACRRFIAGARERLVMNPRQAGDPRNLLDGLLIAHEADHPQLTEDEIFRNAITLLLAGEDTTAHTMAWMIHFLSRHPEVQHRLQAEVDAVMGNDWTLQESRQVDELPYLDAVTHETLRLKPAAPLLFLEPIRNVTIGGVDIPAGTTLMLLMRFASLQEHNFTDAETFRPERWLLPRDTSAYPAHNRAVWMPFGAGPRFCPGRHLAWVEIKTAMATICRNFLLTPPEHTEPVRERFVFTMTPSHSFVRLSSRHASSKA